MLEKDINEILKSALKGGEKLKVSVMRMLMSEISYKKIADRIKELDAEKIAGLIQKMIRQHKESIEKFRQGKRDDLVAKETEEMAILESYLPKQLSYEEICSIVEDAVEKTKASSVKDIGMVIAMVMANGKGRIDGKTAGKIARERLEKIAG